MFNGKLNRCFAHLVFVVTGCFAATGVWAVAQPPPELLGLPWVQIAVAGLISLFGGVGQTAVRALEEAQRRKDKPDEATSFVLKHELLKDLFISAGLGLIIYSIGVRQQLNAELLASALWLSGYMGAKLLNGMSNFVLSYISRAAEKEKS